ncbi:hypothetical protein SCHPADRAFT_922914 [Schizopora paradoxa]|uniref:High-temperature-induced dauer-formation protein n=1 Tax=Schizopora paradoxa TaxID=27342 RepID=A0A0H2R6E1_9AGAM|nr:hypothetical protein SCHPADRAFT_922914 [Schizopora paradoxa]
MLSNLKLPQKLASPLGLFVNDSKLAFRTQPSGIRRLAENRNINLTDSYWDQFITLFDSSSDVFSLISSNDIRRAVIEAPENVETLVAVISSRLFNLVTDHTFPSSANGVASLASSFIKTAASTAGVSTSERNPTKEVLNCLRILSRVLPVLFENENALLEQKIMWTRDAGVEGDGSHAEIADESSQFVIADDEDEEGNVPVVESTSSAPPPDDGVVQDNERKSKRPTLAERLISCAIDLLFCCGFTLPSKIQVDHHKINYVIWEKGVGATVDAGPGNGLEQNKVEVLRFLLVLLSKQIYSSPATLFSKPSQYSLALVQRTARRHVLTILCSLLNTAMNSSKPVMPTSAGSAFESVASSLPYNHLVFKGEDMKELLVGYSLQTLCALLDFKTTSSAREGHTTTDDTTGSTSTLKTNAFRYFLAKLHRTSDFDFIIDGIFGILEQHMSAVHNVLPGSRKPIPYILETIVFLWKAIDLNKKFRNYILESGKVVRLLAYLLCYCMEAKDKPQQHGVCRAISYIIQSLSSENAFGAKLAFPMKVPLPAKWSVQGNVGDFVINSIYTVISTSSGRLNSLYPSLIISLSNSAPHFKNLSIVSSNKLLSLLTSFSSPLFLFSDEGHPRLLFFLLEVFNGIIQNRLNDNPNVVYAVIRSHKVFEDLGTFTLASGLREVKRIELTREEQARLDSKKGGIVDLEKGRTSSNEYYETTSTSSATPETRNSGEVSLRGSDSEMIASAQPLMSPSGEEFPTIASISEENTSHPSEKARGKMPARTSSLSEDMMHELERLASSGVGRKGFVPTQEWVSSWQQGLPLDVILLTISELLPKVQELQASSSKAGSVSSVVDFLRTVSLTHALPPNSVPSPRRFVWTDSSSVWLTSLLWGDIYVRNMAPLGIWNATNVRLFHVKHTQSQTRQLTDAVSSVVGGLGGLLSRNNVGSSEMSSRARTPR